MLKVLKESAFYSFLLKLASCILDHLDNEAAKMSTINIKEIKKIIKDSKINCNVYIIDDNLDIIKVN